MDRQPRQRRNVSGRSKATSVFHCFWPDGHCPADRFTFSCRSSQSMYDNMHTGRALAKNIPFLNAKTACCYLKQHAVFIRMNGGEGGIRKQRQQPSIIDHCFKLKKAYPVFCPKNWRYKKSTFNQCHVRFRKPFCSI